MKDRKLNAQVEREAALFSGPVFSGLVLSGLVVSTLLITAVEARAQDLTYTPVNPSFGGNPLNSGHLLSIANAQRPDEEIPPRPPRPQTTTTDRFLSILESRLLSSVAFDVTDSIFGADAQDSGTFQFEDTRVSFSNDGVDVTIVITDDSTGEVTEIIIPSTVQ